MNTIMNAMDKSSAASYDAGRNKMKRLEAHKNSGFGRELDSVLKKSGDKNRPMDCKLWDACVEAESLFVGKMLKEMKKTVHKSEWLHGGQAEEIFEDMLYDEYALKVSRNSDCGMARMLYEELSRKM